MDKAYNFLAFDLGATSGRTILATLDRGKLEMKELTRFPNLLLPVGGKFYWNIYSLYDSLRGGLLAAAKEGKPIDAIGIDTWGEISSMWARTALSWAARAPIATPIPTVSPKSSSRWCRARKSMT